MKTRPLFTPERIRISRATIQSQSLICALSWAAEYKISYERALKAIVPHYMPLLFELVFEVLKPFVWAANRVLQSRKKRLMVHGIRPFFKSAVESAIQDLQAGFSLSHVLETHLCWWLPEFYIHSVKLAEDKDCVSEALIQLAETTSKVRKRRIEVINLLYYPMAVVSFAIFISWVLGQRILSKCFKIFDDLSHGQEFPYLSKLFLDFTRWLDFEHPLVVIALLQIPWLIYIFGFTHSGDWILVKIPGIRKSILRWKMIDTIQGLSMYSKLKIPLYESLSMVCDHQPSSILKDSLERIREDVVSGIDFKDSWLKHFPNDHLSNFYIKSGLKVDKLPESLDQLAVTLVEEDNRKYAFFYKTVEPLTILLISIFVAFIVFAMYLPMISLFEIGAAWEN